MADVTLAAAFRSGILKASGFIKLENWENQDNKLTVTLIPRDNQWEVFSGTAPDDSGTPLSVSIAGVTYRVLGDTNVNLPASQWDNEGVATSGRNNRKMTKVVRAMSGITIACSLSEMESLRAIAEG